MMYSIFYIFFGSCYVGFLYLVNVYYYFQNIQSDLNEKEKVMYFMKMPLEGNLEFLNFAKYFILGILEKNKKKQNQEIDMEKLADELLDEKNEEFIDSVTNLNYFLNKDNNRVKNVLEENLDIKHDPIIKKDFEEIENEIELSDIGFEMKKKIIKIGKKKRIIV